MEKKKIKRKIIGGYPVSMQVSVAGLDKKTRKLTNGHTKIPGLQKFPDINSRSFETRMIPRYKEMPLKPENLPQPKFSESSEKILKERYLLKGGNLEVAETIAERFWHVAYDIASAEFDFGASEKDVLKKAVKFYELMVSQSFEPNSPTLMNAGKQNGMQYSGCFVLPVGDSLPEIFDAIKFTALIHQTGGGTGFSFSRIRHNGSPVKTTGGVASGPVSFLRVFNSATESIKQGGTRRGANMGILRIDHPDILEFIRCKSELDDNNRPVYEAVAPALADDMSRTHFKMLLLDNQISNFNISVAITDKFMDAYYRDEDYELIDPAHKEVIGKLNAKAVFDEITDRAWQTGDPGVVFIDRINQSSANPVPMLEEIEATNPCGEQPLSPWDSCNLGSINLGKFVKEDGSGVDWEDLREVTHLAVNFLDNVVQVNPFGLEPIYNKVHENRRIGLGVMGWADMLFMLKIPYNSEPALELAEKVMGFINTESHLASQILAKEKGAFPNFPYSIYTDGAPIRNAAITTIAPTGTISIIGDCSSGIEPVFALAYLHKAKGVGDQVRTLTIANKTFENIARREGFYSEDLAKKVMEHGSVSGIEDVPTEWQEVFVTAQEIHPDWHVKMQAAFQKYTDNAVSKTINLSNSASPEDVKKAYLMAWDTGCKGITIYRDGSKGIQVLNISSSLKPKEEINNGTLSYSQDTLSKRPMILRGRTYKIMTPVGEGFVTVNRDDRNRPFEVFTTIGKGGMHTMADAEAIGRLASLALRIAGNNRVEIAQKIVAQLRGIGGSSHIGFGKDRVMSLADAIAKVLAEDLAQNGLDEVDAIPLNLTIFDGNNEVPEDEKPSFSPKSAADLCPECGLATFVFEEGCKKCHSCGYSMC